MKNFTILGLIIFISLLLPLHTLADEPSNNKFYFKGSDPGYGVGTYRDDLTKADDSIEYSTVSVYQYYNPSYLRGEAFVKGYTRIESIERYFNNHSIYLDSVRVGLRDVDSKNMLHIRQGMQPTEQSSSTFLSEISWLASGLPWYYGEPIKMFANGLTTGVRHGNDGTYHHRWVEAYGYGLDPNKLSADNSVIYSGVEEWENDTSTTHGFAAYIPYYFNSNPGEEYELRGYTQNVFVVNPYSYCCESYKYYSGRATNLHKINDPS